MPRQRNYAKEIIILKIKLLEIRNIFDDDGGSED
jgi:hypothetical protein